MPNELIPEIESILRSKFYDIVGKYYEIPKILYHYTNITGLVGIIGSQKLWATDRRFLNDSSEISYGLELVKEILSEKIENEKSEVVSEFMRRSLNIDIVINIYEIYISCFCEEGNLLSQWRGYGDKGDGYSIGIEPEKIKNRNYQIGKVIYSREEQNFIINSILDYHCKLISELACERGVKANRDLITSFTLNFSTLVSQIICLFKHPTFAEEKEWRYVYLIPKYTKPSESIFFSSLDTVKFRNNSEYLIPYIEIDLVNEENEFKIPIKRVISGPSKQPELKKVSLEQFMEKKECFKIEIIDSNIPFRN